MIPVVASSVQQQAINIVNTRSQAFNQYALQDVARLKNEWLSFWDPGLSPAVMQAVLDLMASNTFNDPHGTPTNGWAYYFTSALAEITDILRTSPAAFADAKLEQTGVLQPTGQPYQQYLTPGWYYTVDNTKPSGIAISTPCVWTL